MKSRNVSSVSKKSSIALIPRLAALLLLVGVVVSSLYVASSASSLGRRVIKTDPLTAGKQVSSDPGLDTPMSPRLGRFGSFLAPPMFAAAVSTFAADCTTPKTLFARGDTVCAQVTGAQAGWQVIWSNAEFVAVQTNTLTSGNQSVSFTLSPTASLGDWRVILFEPIGGSVQGETRFTVSDAQNPQVDVSVSKGQVSSDTAAGAQVVFSVQVSNFGPDSATSVALTDVVPTNTTFVAFDQLSGPLFTCTNPTAGSTGSTVCTVPNLANGETALFLATYLVNGGVSAGDSIANTATVSTTITDSNAHNDSSTAAVPVVGSPCVLTCPTNITQHADSGQAGAIVNYAAITSTGDCGQPVTGENGETIPPITSNPTSGSFFSVGTTTVIATSQTGSVCTFQVTIDNPGGLSISLNGASTVTVECGSDFNDPGATAVNGTGQSVPVVTTLPGGFNPDSPAVGSYTITYTATEDPNSVSTTRTVNVTDTQAPTITVVGANPYKIEQGSCTPFTDPGATADDGCAGPKPVTTSVAGPGGRTSVDPSTAGTYTVTYTATDGTHSATATRTVLVGTFPQDEVDQPAGTNVPPTITLVGDDQITIECGTPFTDPGATASVCGGSVPVTTTGTVNIHAPGTYTITYTATANTLTSTATRSVTVNPDNTAPVITVTGANPMTVECHTTFTDPGAVAHDACAGDFAATASGSVNPNTVGQYTITYNATDPSGHAATPVARTVNVVDTTKPDVTAPPNVTVSTGSGATSCSVTVSDATLGTASANDSCQGSLSTSRSGVPSGNVFPVGQTTITYSATDASGNTGTATQTVTVIDNTLPTITTNGQTLSMWPPNHKYQTFQVTNFVTAASDNCTTLGVANVVIEKVTSDETENGNGDGNTTDDIVIAANCKSVQLRSERDGAGNGRVYTITFKVTDASGNVGRATAKVTVAHNPGETPVDSGVHYTVNGTCP